MHRDGLQLQVLAGGLGCWLPWVTGGYLRLHMPAVMQHVSDLCQFNQGSMLHAGFIKTNLFKSNTAVGLRDDSPYNQFSHVSH